jgi:tRNA A37 threonylcarbamoyladenosine modification protein TsaB
MLHFANGVKIVAVDSLDVTAANISSIIEPRASRIEYRVSSIEYQVSRIEKVAVVVDAKRNQFFIAVYERQTTNHEPQATSHESPVTNHGIWKKLLPDSLMTAEEFLQKFTDSDRPIHLLGDGLLYHKDKFTAPGVIFFDEKYWSPRAENVHLLGYHLALAGQFSDPLTLTPNYLLRPDIKVKTR